MKELLLLADVFGADFDCREEAEERSACCSSFDGRAAVGFFAFNDADDGNDGHAGLASGFDGVNGGGAGGADVVYDDDASTLAAEAFNAAGSSMLLFGFADEEAVYEWRSGIRLSGTG
jgi:hypothetical protein